jgi:hypothetical protein
MLLVNIRAAAENYQGDLVVDCRDFFFPNTNDIHFNVAAFCGIEEKFTRPLPGIMLKNKDLSDHDLTNYKFALIYQV